MACSRAYQGRRQGRARRVFAFLHSAWPLDGRACRPKHNPNRLTLLPRTTASLAVFGSAFALVALVLIAVLLPLAAPVGEAAYPLVQTWVQEAVALGFPV